MKLDPGMHIGLHLVFLGQTGVTIGVGAGEEQARKVVAGEASRCGEDK
jgi:hypothetical protein